MRDSVMRGEAPIASHLIYTQRGILRDGDPHERDMGIAAGLEWGKVADVTVVYADRGISAGMWFGIEAAKTAGRPVEHRFINAKGPEPSKK